MNDLISSASSQASTARDDREHRAIRVLGMGNVLLGDDGFGPYAIKMLEAGYEIRPPVEAIDAGTPGLDLTPYLAGARAVIIIDTVQSDGPPGTLRTYDLEQLLAAPPLPRTSPHEPGLREALLATELIDESPRHVLLIGVVPASTETGPGLGRAVRAAVPRALDRLLSELESLGAPAIPRIRPLQPDIWWEQETGEQSP